MLGDAMQHDASRGLWIGTSGWSYPDWGGGFYEGAPRADWLRLYATRFEAVEVNATADPRFDREPLQRWALETPPGFRFTMKGSRHVTHVRRLAVQPHNVAAERARAQALGDKLGVVLWQIKRAWACDYLRLAGFLQLLRAWPEVRHAFEFRDETWFVPEVTQLLAEHGAVNVISDARNWARWDAVTGGAVYLRLHGRERTYVSRYDDAALAEWATRIERWRAQGMAVWVFFDNAAAGHAPNDALRLRALCERFEPSLAPATRAA
jgi:uncharacterized protein YecE (DUF72 family)